jgi:polar amino acid transport system substrate-binding protein
LQAGRYRFAVSSQWSLDWFNRLLPTERRLQPLVVLEEQHLGCMVRNDPKIPSQGLLQVLGRMKQTGEIERAFQRYSRPASTPIN